MFLDGVWMALIGFDPIQIVFYIYKTPCTHLTFGCLLASHDRTNTEETKGDTDSVTCGTHCSLTLLADKQL